MQAGAPRIVCLGRQDRSDAGSRGLLEAISIGSDGRFVVPEEEIGKEEFDRGSIDWRGVLESTHWLLNTSSAVLDGDSSKWAWGASMAFAELEGCRTVMIVDPADGNGRTEEAWGSVIERIRQVHVLFFQSDAIDEISLVEGVVARNLLKEVRKRGLVPIVCSYDVSSGVVVVEHSLGSLEIEIEEEVSAERWLAEFLCALPNTGPGASGIEAAARLESR